jgi:hypothetical protein
LIVSVLILFIITTFLFTIIFFLSINIHTTK